MSLVLSFCPLCFNGGYFLSFILSHIVLRHIRLCVILIKYALFWLVLGSKVAPSYANLFMARLEEKFLEKVRTDLPLYLCYIDNIFFIFPYSETKLEEFMTLMNPFHKTIKFTEEHSREEIIFLDTYVKRNGRFTIHRPVRQRDGYTQLSSLHIMSPHRFSQKWQLGVCKLNFRVCKMPLLMKIPMKMKQLGWF